MRTRTTCLTAVGLAAFAGSQVAGANFNRIATFANYVNNLPGGLGDETVSEIIAATADGNTIVYTDSELEQIGFVDITNPAMPIPTGTFAVGGEPTSVAVLGNDYVLVGVNTSPSFTSPSGFLAVVDITGAPVLAASIDLGGQPDSVAISPDGTFAAVAIENERDEEICVGGTNDTQFVDEDDDVAAAACEAGGGQVGVIPQNGPGTAIGNPAGYLVVISGLAGLPGTWTDSVVPLTGLAGAFGASDPEPEFVDINTNNQAVVTLQENNHIAIVDLGTLTVTSSFTAGTADLLGVDATEDDLISMTEDLLGVPREPDAVTWLGTDRVATADEGDMFGGSRGFTIFQTDGTVVFQAGAGFEEHATQIGHYPEGRSENKGAEPEAIETGNFGGDDYLFVGSERGSFIAVYHLPPMGDPVFQQVLPGPLAPEGALAIPDKNLFLASGESDDPSFGVRSTIMIYEYQDGADAEYPSIQSDFVAGKPIGWSALSGMVNVPGSDDELLAVWDSFFGQAQIFTIDVTSTPAQITSALPITGGSGDFDSEGIANAPDGTTWIASEGNGSGSRPNRLLQIDALGTVIDEIFLPSRVTNCRNKSTADGLQGGFEGLAIVEEPTGPISAPGNSGDYWVVVAQQRGWNYTTNACRKIDDDPLDEDDLEPAQTRLWVYDVGRNKWLDPIVYELAPKPANASWVGLSEVTRVDGGFVVIERDNRTGDFAELKTLVFFDDAAIADGRVTAAEKVAVDIIPDLLGTNGWITDKPEGVAVTPNGEVYLVTDNDGVDEWSGETTFLRLGDLATLFGL